MPHITLETLGRGITASPTPTNATIVVQAWDAHGPKVQVSGPRVVSSPRNVITVVDGVPDREIHLGPTDGTYGQRWSFAFAGVDGEFVRFTDVPDVAEIDFGDLATLDPDTLQPSPGAVAAWESTVVAATQALQGAQAARLGAEAARDAALAGQFAGADLGTAHLDTVTTPGAYRQSNTARATTAQGYPEDGSPITMFVQTSGTGGAGLVQRVIVTARAGRAGMGEWIRTRGTSAESFSPWRFSPVIEVDQSVGRVYRAYDHINARLQMIHGDTGRRNITATGTTTTPFVGGSLILRRIGWTVSLELVNLFIGGQLASTNYVFDGMLPVGFRSPGASRLALAQVVASSGLLTVYGSGSDRIVITPGTTSPLYQTVMWQTTDAWPASLPGVPADAGGIPNL